VPLDFAIDKLAPDRAGVDLPVTVRSRSGYGKNPTAVGQSVNRTIQAGAIAAI